MDEVKELKNKIEKLSEKEQFKEIVDLLPDKLLDKHNNAELYAWRAWAYDSLGKAGNAITDQSKAIELKKDYTDTYFNRGILWDAKGEYDKAIADYTKAIELKKDYVEAYFNRAVLWDVKGEYDKAITDYGKAIELKKDYADAYNNRGLVWYAKGEYEKAIADFDKAIELKKDYADAYNNRGTVWDINSEYEKAIADYTKAIELKEDYADAYYNRGIIWDKLNEYDKAITDYDKAIELKKDYANAYNNRGIVWDKLAEYDKAFADYNKAIEFRKDYAEAYNNRGIIWYNKGQNDTAITDYNKAIEINNDYASAYNNRGVAYDLKGEFQKAIEDYEKAMKLDNIRFGGLDYYIKLATEKIAEGKSLEASNAEQTDKEKRIHIENEIKKTINTIRNAARSEVKTVVHYTKVFVADIYVKSMGAKMHYSNAIYMNDPMEGHILFEYLNDKEIEEAYRFGEKRTETSVYLGSFLPAEEKDGSITHEDELIMWRTYGKDENGKEAAGSSVVLSSDFFNTKTESKEVVSQKEVSREELLNVVYIKSQKEEKKITDDPNGEIKTAMENLKKLLQDLLQLRKKYEDEKKGDFYKDIENIIFKQLSTISYLFKSADYQFEKEVRVITYMPRDSDLIKYREIKEANAPSKRFYIESLNDILPFIKKIFLGPKVEHYQQWSLYFDYEVRQRAKEIGALPTVLYKIKPSDIQIVKSERKFQ